VYRYVRNTIAGALVHDMRGWEEDSYDTLPVPIVPVIQFLNRADMDGGAQGEFETHLGLLDRINYGVLNRLEIATLQAFRQRAIKGVPDRDAQGAEIDYSDVFSMDPGAMWILPETADLWEQAMATAFLIAGDTQRAQRADMSVIWAPPERFTLSERYDAAVKANAAGVPWRQTMQDVLQFDPQTIDRMEADRANDILLVAAAGAAAATAAPAGPPARPDVAAAGR
jgi:hypothetical protein